MVDQPTRAERYFQQIEAELNQERAALLGRYGQRVEAALARCATQLEHLDLSDQAALAAYRAARADALQAVDALCLQREMLGLTDHSWVHRIFTLPPRH